MDSNEKKEIKTLDFYKEIYFKENEKKKEFDNLVNVPILIYTTIVVVNLFVLEKFMKEPSAIEFTNYLLKSLVAITLGSIGYSIFCLLQSFVNFPKSYIYKEIGKPKEIFDYELNLREEQETLEDAELLMNNYLKDSFMDCANTNFFINQKRSDYYAQSKNGIFLGVVSTMLIIFIYFIKLINF
ncbi:hypothetical protein M2347_000712 [Chryseobacterium sp. H1D6B]|uniref:hypothetical protein n=1 Tax=Chryseobacterium sp. H1D6B TaxID=2940588 RepID=UPI0015CC2D93|nr:hypothetical protein [Chryseobacterium sp. H1D6B]MDH6250985.1 hypothetical protein [Chryseobacterium sp. H1D6B]